MKKPMIYTSLMAIALFAVSALSAQDILETNPDHAELIQESNKVRMILVTLQPGDSLAAHTHPAHMIYVIQGGMLEESTAAGKREKYDMQAGFNLKSPAMPLHAEKNVGDTPIQMMIVEIRK